jgi:hypothetical protein
MWELMLHFEWIRELVVVNMVDRGLLVNMLTK